MDLKSSNIFQGNNYFRLYNILNVVYAENYVIYFYIFLRYSYLVPYVMFANDLVMAIGAGMTVKFFPLFFANDYGFSPMQVIRVKVCICMHGSLMALHFLFIALSCL